MGVKGVYDYNIDNYSKGKVAECAEAIVAPHDVELALALRAGRTDSADRHRRHRLLHLKT